MMSESSVAETDNEPTGVVAPMSLFVIEAITLLTTVLAEPAPDTLTPTPAMADAPAATLPAAVRDHIRDVDAASTTTAPTASTLLSSIIALTELSMVFTAIDMPKVAPTPAAPPRPKVKDGTPALAMISVSSEADTDREPTEASDPISLLDTLAVTSPTMVFTEPAPDTLTATPAIADPPTAPPPAIVNAQMADVDVASRSTAPTASTWLSSTTASTVWSMVFTARDAPIVPATPAARPKPKEKDATPALAMMLVSSKAEMEKEPTGDVIPISLSDTVAATSLSTVFTETAPFALTPTPAIADPPAAPEPEIVKAQMVAVDDASRLTAPVTSTVLFSRYAVTSLTMVFTATEPPRVTPTPAAPPILRLSCRTPALARIVASSVADMDSDPTGDSVPTSVLIIYADTSLFTVLAEPDPDTATPTPAMADPPTVPDPATVIAHMVDDEEALRSTAPRDSTPLSSMCAVTVLSMVFIARDPPIGTPTPAAPPMPREN